MRLRILAPGVVIVIAAVLAFIGLHPQPAGGAENVLVICNASSSISCRVADYYVTKRSIARANLLNINVPDSSISSENEAISLADYQAKIEVPIREYLAKNELVDKVQYIVLTKGIPIRITADSATGVNGQAVDSLLAAIDIKDPLVINVGSSQKRSLAAINRYWRSTEPFSHEKYGGYLVTRLDGYTEADAKALVDRAMAPQTSPLQVLMDAKCVPTPEDIAKHPISILLPDGTGNRSFALTYGDFDADMARACEIIKTRPGISLKLDETGEFVGSENPLTIYVSWGSNAGKGYKADTYHSIKFAARGIVETAVSTSGRTFLPTKGGQSLIADMIAQGAAGAKGYVTEPYLHAMASPTVLADLYTSGRNLAESFYASSRFIGWKDIVIGDPLCRLDVPKEKK